jgi:predicted  nucleic acid-binding Zn-ribbon protein
MRSADDRTLDLMTAAEPLDAAVKKAEADLKIEKQHVETEKKKAQARTAEDQKAVAEARTERAAIVAEAPPELVALYEKIRKRWGATVVTEVEDDLCKGCKLSLRPQFLQDLRLGGKVMQCENCGRLILYNPPVAPVVG